MPHALHIAARNVLVLLTACAVPANNLFAAPMFRSDAGCATESAPREMTAASAAACCGAKCRRCCGCCETKESDAVQEPSTVCPCDDPFHAPAAPTSPSPTAPKDLKVSDGFGKRAVDAADVARAAASTRSEERAAIPMLSGGVRVHFCIWLT